MNIEGLQENLFKQIQRDGKNRKTLVAEISQLLNLGPSAVYKRIKGSVLLNLEELLILSKHYHISLDQAFFPHTPFTSFDFSALRQKPTSFSSFLQGIQKDLETAKELEDCTIYYVSNDLPIFHYFFFPELLAFKLFIWGRNIWEWPAFQKKNFSIDQMLEDFPVIDLSDKILESYLSIPSIEIWKTNILDNFLNQIKYYSTSPVFALSKDAQRLCDRLKKLIHHLDDMASHKKKFLPGASPNFLTESNNFQLYQNEISNTNNLVLVKAASTYITYTTFDSPNLMISTEPQLGRYTQDWFHRILHRSQLISGTERNRMVFFNELSRKVEGMVEGGNGGR